MNNKLLPKQIEAAGLQGDAVVSADKQLVEIIEIPNHPWFVACQFHPEFTSTPRDGHPLFAGFVKAAGEYQKRQAEVSRKNLRLWASRPRPHFCWQFLLFFYET